MSTLRIALAQLNPTVGDLEGNRQQLIASSLKARDEMDCDLVVFPELALCGYPPEDLLLRQDFLDQAAASLQTLRQQVHGIAMLVGHPLYHPAAGEIRRYNALSVLKDGHVLACYHKRCLPNYSVFDEKRYFQPGTAAAIVELGGYRIGLMICEDLWESWPVEQTVALGADLIITINASPFHDQQANIREQQIVCPRARQFDLPILYVNQVGGQDELVFDGCSLAVNGDGRVAARLPAFETCLHAVNFTQRRFEPNTITPQKQGAPLVYDAIVLGLRDYISKHHFKGFVLGLSGGIDSALSLALAVDAIGAERVMAVMLPSRYTRDISREDARAEADALGVRYTEISIEPIFQATLHQLSPTFTAPGVDPSPTDTTAENIQARIRGTLLMALSNKLGYLLLSTGNKSEMAVGYATLYGDMAGGFCALKDVPKGLVYELARHRNRQAPVIPPRVLERPPSAELAADQCDQDSLPPYDILDSIIEAFVEQDHSIEQLIAAGFDAATVQRVVQMIVRNEHKRRQAAPGVRVTARAFGRDRRYPITSGYHKDN